MTNLRSRGQLWKGYESGIFIKVVAVAWFLIFHNSFMKSQQLGEQNPQTICTAKLANSIPTAPKQQVGGDKPWWKQELHNISTCAEENGSNWASEGPENPKEPAYSWRLCKPASEQWLNLKRFPYSNSKWAQGIATNSETATVQAQRNSLFPLEEIRAFWRNGRFSFATGNV